MREGKGSFLKRHAMFEVLLVYLDGDVQTQFAVWAWSMKRSRVTYWTGKMPVMRSPSETRWSLTVSFVG